ncbi:MAG: hypothetical protein DMD99_05560 [Candidatus Rokuibacteriota bacterium]|nr:MAG: hypothetical protein DMD99_05560 [Candidatus Rokubacteria bacterium]
MKGAGIAYGWREEILEEPRGASTRDIEAAFRDAAGASLLSRPAVSQVAERLWQEYEAFAGRDLSEFLLAYLFVDRVAERLHAGPAARGSASGGSSRRGSLEQARRPLPVSDRGCPADGRGAQGDANPSTADRTVIETAGRLKNTDNRPSGGTGRPTDGQAGREARRRRSRSSSDLLGDGQ